MKIYALASKFKVIISKVKIKLGFLVICSGIIFSSKTFGQTHHAFDKMNEEELLEYLAYCQERPRVQSFHIVSNNIRLGIFGPNEAIILDQRNLMVDTIDIGYNPFRNFVGNSFRRFYHLTDSTGFGINDNLMTYFHWKENELEIEKFVVLKDQVFKQPNAKRNNIFLIHNGLSFGSALERMPNGSKKLKEAPRFDFADSEVVSYINPDPKVVNYNIYNDEIGMSNWFEDCMFIVGNRVFISSEMENRCYIVDTKTKEVSFFSFPQVEGALRVTYDNFQKKFYIIKKVKKVYEIMSLSEDFKKISAGIISIDQEPLKIYDGKVLVKFKTKKSATPCHYLVPLFPEQF